VRKPLCATTMEISLGTVRDEESGPSIELGDEITQEQYENFQNAIAEIHELEHIKRLFEITFLNKNDFVDTYNRDVKKLIESSWTLAGDRKKYNQHHLNFNRLFLNYLSSIRSFIDHNQTLITRKFGKDSEEIAEFKKICKYYYDNFFCYRFFYKLRNYSQHCGLPLKDFNLSTNRHENGSYSAEAEMTFDSVLLLEEYDWGTVVTADLKKINGEFSLAPIVEDMTKVLLGFWQAVDTLYLTKVSKAVKFIKDNTDHLRADNTDVCIFYNIVDNPDGSLKTFERLTIPLDLVDELT
jgi:hypothetical protein